MWLELWYEMADGVPSEIERIKAIDIFEFYTVLDLWNAKKKRDFELMKAKIRSRIG